MRKQLPVAVQALDDVAHHGVVRVFFAFQKLARRLLGLVLAFQPFGVCGLHGFRLFVANDHVFFELADGTHLAPQLGHVAHLGKRVVHEVLAHRMDAEHAQHARAAQQAQQTQNHADGPQHSKTYGELPHEREEIHDLSSFIYWYACAPVAPPPRPRIRNKSLQFARHR
ncbi:hypothetical protein D3C72_1378220 [compost metagenome]